MDATEIVDGIWQGGELWPRLPSGFDAVLGLRAESEDYALPLARVPGLRVFVWAPMVDGPQLPDAATLHDVVGMVIGWRAMGWKCLVHCAEGLNRSRPLPRWLRRPPAVIALLPAGAGSWGASWPAAWLVAADNPRFWYKKAGRRSPEVCTFALQSPGYWAMNTREPLSTTLGWMVSCILLGAMIIALTCQRARPAEPPAAPTGNHAAEVRFHDGSLVRLSLQHDSIDVVVALGLAREDHDGIAPTVDAGAGAAGRRAIDDGLDLSRLPGPRAAAVVSSNSGNYAYRSSDAKESYSGIAMIRRHGAGYSVS